MFRDAETKAAVRAGSEEQSLALLLAWLRHDPEIEELADGAFRLKEYKNVVPVPGDLTPRRCRRLMNTVARRGVSRRAKSQHNAAGSG